MSAVVGHRSRARDLGTRSRRRWRRLGGDMAQRVRRTPLPPPVRGALTRVLVWHAGLRTIPVDRVLLGGQNGLSTAAFAAAHGDLGWGSTPVALGPHARLLEAAAARELSDGEVLASEYAAMARTCIRETGAYFSATDDAGILDVARRFVASVQGSPEPAPTGKKPAGTTPEPHRSREGSPVLVAPIRGSSCFQVVDGHHRLAAAALRGEETARVRVRRWQVSTPALELLEDMSWIGGRRELYQPVPLPEVSEWPRARHCTDRARAMELWLARYGPEHLTRPGARYLDVASCYGWFLARMQRHGFEVHGIERDPLALPLGAVAYGLDPARIRTGDAVELLRDTSETFDVVSCFSLLHHFVLGRGSCGPEELVRLLGKVTGHVLFLDTGQEHEEWFKDSLRGWDSAAIAAFLERHGGFDRVVDLGPDQDDEGPYSGNYGRHLFACVREA
jgi:SAM-dependent methyltransferase